MKAFNKEVALIMIGYYQKRIELLTHLNTKQSKFLIKHYATKIKSYEDQIEQFVLKGE